MFGRRWSACSAARGCYLGHESEIPAVGDFAGPRRAPAGPRDPRRRRSVHGLLNRCSHRGAVLVAEQRVVRSGSRARTTGGRTRRRALVGCRTPSSTAGSTAIASISGGCGSQSYRGFVFGTLARGPPPVRRVPGGRRGVARRPHRPAPRWAAARAADAAPPSTAATGSCRGTTPPTACTPRSPTVRTTTSAGPSTSTRCSRATRRPPTCTARRSATATWSSTSGPGSRPARGRRCGRCRSGGDGGRRSRARRRRRRGAGAGGGNMVNLSLFPNLILVGNQLMVVEPVAVDRTRLTSSWWSARSRRGGQPPSTARRRGLRQLRHARRPRDVRARAGGSGHRRAAVGRHQPRHRRR